MLLFDSCRGRLSLVELKSMSLKQVNSVTAVTHSKFTILLSHLYSPPGKVK